MPRRSPLEHRHHVPHDPRHVLGSAAGPGREMRHEVRVGARPQRVVLRRRLRIVHVEERLRPGVRREVRRERLVVEHHASAGVEEHRAWLEERDEPAIDEASIGRSTIDVQRDHVALGEERLDVHGLGGGWSEAIDRHEVVEPNPEADRGGDLRDAATDPTKPEDPEGQVIHLPFRHDLASKLMPSLRRDRSREHEAGAQGVAEERGDVLDHRLGVRVGGMDHLDPSLAAGSDIDVVETDAGATDDLELGEVGEKVMVHPGVGPDDQTFRKVRKLLERGILRTAPLDPGTTREPCRRALIETFRDDEERSCHAWRHIQRGRSRFEPDGLGFVSGTFYLASVQGAGQSWGKARVLPGDRLVIPTAAGASSSRFGRRAREGTET